MSPTGRRLARLAEIPVTELRGVGPKKAESLAEMGITSVLDLLMHYPRRWADRSNCVAIGELVEELEASVSAGVASVTQQRLRGGRSIVRVVLEDGTGELSAVFFNQPWRARQLKRGAEVVAFGKVESYRGRLQMTNPVVDLVGEAPEPQTGRQTGRIVPIYPQSERAGVTSFELARYVAEALERSGELADPLPEPERLRHGLTGRTEAFRSIHAPETMEDRHRARRRLAFDELFRLQVELVLRKRAATEARRGIAHDVAASESGGLLAAFLSNLGFALTGAQHRALAAIAADLARPHPMHRLLQGDVGSGKTVVAIGTLLYGIQGGYQGAFMVPTEVLAEQHHLAAVRLLEGLKVSDPARLNGERTIEVALLTSRTPGAERARIARGLEEGTIDLLVGTHALITEGVRFASLGVVVIDEQHRFGVDQRAALRDKGAVAGPAAGRDPDLLVMTATPIPRTAAMTVYGDLDVTVLDELPAGRAPVRTAWLGPDEPETAAWERIRAEVAAGHQAYVVCPLVRSGAPDGGHGEGLGLEDVGELGELDESRDPTSRAAVDEHDRLSVGELAGIRTGLLHGQLPAREKEQVMGAFRAGELAVLVATTVVEVGVDVPAATVMVVEDADRFGIAQLHQLRGRVGRGSARSWCYLLTGEVTEDATKRLEALVASTDGFELAEVDLDLRGEGTVLGARQKGRNELRLASLRSDRDLVRLAREVAERVVEADPTLAGLPLLVDELHLFIDDEESSYLSKS